MERDPGPGCNGDTAERGLKSLRLPQTINADGLLFAFQFSLAQIDQLFARRQAITEIGREQHLLIEFFHHRFEAENGVHDIADDGGIALRIEPDVTAGNRAIMERDPDVKRLAVGPLGRAREREEIARNLQRRGAIRFLPPRTRSSKQASRRR